MKRNTQRLLVIGILMFVIAGCQSNPVVKQSAPPPSSSLATEVMCPDEAISAVLSESFTPAKEEIKPNFDPNIGQNGAQLLEVGSLPAARLFSPPENCTAVTDSEYEKAVIELINQERAKYGLQALSVQYQLTNAALRHNTSMACENYFSHTGSDNTSPFTRIKDEGYSYSYAGENLYAGNGSYNEPGSCVTGWLNSPGHRDNMLNAEFVHAGISYLFNPNSKYGGYFTIVFARP
jgi:uncharacterized protein YkwD